MALVSRRNGRRPHQNEAYRPLNRISEYPVSQVHFSSESLNEAVLEDDDEKDWNQTGFDIRGVVSEKDRKESLAAVRFLAANQPNIIQGLRLYRSYIIGDGFQISLVPKDTSKPETDKDKKVIREAKQAITDFVMHNWKWWNWSEFSNRVYRDGEQFTKKGQTQSWPPDVRFIDPEEIADPSGDTGTRQGIITDNDDTSVIVAYTRINPADQKLIEKLEADEIWHTKIDVDSTQKRGISRFFPVRKFAKRFDGFLTNEVIHRNIQSSIVIHRKVHGSPSRVTDVMNSAKTSTTKYPETTLNREKIRPGTILTTNHGVELEFLQPSSDFTDATPLAKMLIMQISAATGWPYYAISTDSSDANFASSLVQESPVVLMIKNERMFIGMEILPIIVWVLQTAVRHKKISFRGSDLFEKYDVSFRFSSLDTRDPVKEGQRINLGIMNGTISRAEGSRQQNVDPERMRIEREQEAESDLLNVGAMNTVPNTLDPNNNTGGNQGDDGSQTSGDDDSQIQRRAAQGQ